MQNLIPGELKRAYMFKVVDSCRTFFRKHGLILSEVFWHMEEARISEKYFITVQKKSFS